MIKYFKTNRNYVTIFSDIKYFHLKKKKKKVKIIL